MTTPAAPNHRLRPWHIALIAIGAIVIVLALGIWLTAAGIIGYAATGGSSEQDRDRAFSAADPAGSAACDRLDSFMALHLGSFLDAQAEAGNALTAGIRNATAPEEMRRACIAAGANMSPSR